MEETRPLSSLTPLFTPRLPSDIVESIYHAALLKDDAVKIKAESVKWSEMLRFVIEVVPGNDKVLLKDVIDYTNDLVDQGLVDRPLVNQLLVKQLSLRGAFTVEKAQWIQDQGFELAPTQVSSFNIHHTWAEAQDDEAFDWAFSTLSAAEESPERTKAMFWWLDSVVKDLVNRKTVHRFEQIEKARPGIVREWVSSMPGYDKYPYSSTDDTDNNIKDRLASRHRLERFFVRTLSSQNSRVIADWLDPAKYGTPKSVNILFEAAVSVSYHKSTHVISESAVVWASLARAVESRPQAKQYWEKQSHFSKLRPTLALNRPRTELFSSQRSLFDNPIVGKDHPIMLAKDKVPRWDCSLPMEPLGRLLGAADPLAKGLATTSEGRSKIIDVMKSHPVFMAYGFACLGADILSWKEAEQLDGFRDEHGYGAARYALSLCSPVKSDFDVNLHRYLRQNKGICDEASPALDGLFIDESSQAKYKSMELRRISREVVRERGTKRVSTNRSPLM